MSVLPKLEMPKHTITLPLSQKKVDFRPYTMKEKRIMLQAIELGDINQINNAISDIVKTCTFNKIEIENIPNMDIEFLVLQLRAKSVGEVIEVRYKCQNEVEDDEHKKSICGNTILGAIKLTELTVDIPDNHEYKIQLTDNIGIELQDISYGDIIRASEMEDPKEIELFLRNSAIKTIYTNDEMWTKADFTTKELNEFLDGLEVKDYEKIETFIKTKPELTYTLHLRCNKCKHEEDIELRGMNDFLI